MPPGEEMDGLGYPQGGGVRRWMVGVIPMGGGGGWMVSIAPSGGRREDMDNGCYPQGRVGGKCATTSEGVDTMTRWKVQGNIWLVIVRKRALLGATGL